VTEVPRGFALILNSDFDTVSKIRARSFSFTISLYRSSQKFEIAQPELGHLQISIK
jgi:uncharacterized protein (DUF2461 family)